MTGPADEEERAVAPSRITPTLWFDGRVEEAADLYVSVFEDARVLRTTPYPEGAPGPASGVLTVELELAGQRLVLLNGGPGSPPTEAFSLSVACADQAEVDRVWEALLAGGGRESQCGWLVDRFGVSWQVVPEGLAELLGDPDPGRARRATEAMLGMRRLDLAAMRRAAEEA
ncbi:VOC family protein [uncultured Pseudokineococcus sp.]|uniref:VOC family protein n=1 Tax=uncultured Pseudokineococcus sp. TaxID=1642928 RepID=UPI0026262476|nr:VOC family protein [uncultured Pseudokineococcus sp.]